MMGAGDSYIFGDGYSQTTPVNIGTITRYVTSISEVATKTWIPATPAIPSTPTTPPTPAQFNKIMDKGWTSWSRSIGELPVGSYYEFSVNTGVNGALLGLAPADNEGCAINSFSHALLCDLSGIHVFENGEITNTLTSQCLYSFLLRIYRHSDGSIVYAVINGTNIYLFKSATTEKLNKTLYVYAMLYMSGDTILSSVFSTGEVAYGAVDFVLNIDLAFLNCDVKFNINIDLSVNSGTFSSVNFPLDIDVSFSGQSNYGRALLPRLCSIGGEIPDGYGYGFAMLPGLTSNGEGGFYRPPDPEYGFAMLPRLRSFGILKTSSPGSGSASIVLQSIGGEAGYGFGSAMLPSLQSKAYEGPPKSHMSIMNYLYPFDGVVLIHDQIMFVNSSGTIVDIISGTRSLIQSIIERLQITDTYNVIGNFSFSLDSSGLIYGPQQGKVVSGGKEKPGVDPQARTWVVNMDTAATGQYDGYGFLRFFKRDGQYYGVAEDGIYLLGGEDDNGFPIDSLIDFGRSDLGIDFKKGLVNVYTGASSTGKLILKIDVDGKTYYYEARSSSEDINMHRFDVGKGLNFSYINFTLLNQNGDDFEVEKIHFTPIKHSRKI